MTIAPPAPTDERNTVEWMPLMPAVPAKPRSARITPMQLRVLESLCEGKNTAQVAKDWGIGEDTVKSHVKELLRRTGARDRLQLVVWSFTNQLRITLSRGSARRNSPMVSFARDEALDLV